MRGRLRSSRQGDPRVGQPLRATWDCGLQPSQLSASACLTRLTRSALSERLLTAIESGHSRQVIGLLSLLLGELRLLPGVVVAALAHLASNPPPQAPLAHLSRAVSVLARTNTLYSREVECIALRVAKTNTPTLALTAARECLSSSSWSDDAVVLTEASLIVASLWRDQARSEGHSLGWQDIWHHQQNDRHSSESFWTNMGSFYLLDPELPPTDTPPRQPDWDQLSSPGRLSLSDLQSPSSPVRGPPMDQHLPLWLRVGSAEAFAEPSAKRAAEPAQDTQWWFIPLDICRSPPVQTGRAPAWALMRRAAEIRETPLDTSLGGHSLALSQSQSSALLERRRRNKHRHSMLFGSQALSSSEEESSDDDDDQLSRSSGGQGTDHHSQREGWFQLARGTLPPAHGMMVESLAALRQALRAESRCSEDLAVTLAECLEASRDFGRARATLLLASLEEDATDRVLVELVRMAASHLWAECWLGVKGGAFGSGAWTNVRMKVLEEALPDSDVQPSPEAPSDVLEGDTGVAHSAAIRRTYRKDTRRRSSRWRSERRLEAAAWAAAWEAATDMDQHLPPAVGLFTGVLVLSTRRPEDVFWGWWSLQLAEPAAHWPAAWAAVRRRTMGRGMGVYGLPRAIIVNEGRPGRKRVRSSEEGVLVLASAVREMETACRRRGLLVHPHEAALVAACGCLRASGGRPVDWLCRLEEGGPNTHILCCLADLWAVVHDVAQSARGRETLSSAQRACVDVVRLPAKPFVLPECTYGFAGIDLRDWTERSCSILRDASERPC
jgi:hypothetical protein